MSNLDARLRVQMRTEIARLQKRLGTTTVYVTHDQAEAMTLGDRVAVLRAGDSCSRSARPRELYERTEQPVRRRLHRLPGMNFLPAELVDSRLRLPMAELDLPEPLRAALAGREGPFVAGIRPEHIREARSAERASRGGASAVFSARADVVEWMGAETYVHFALGDERRGGRAPMVARIGGESEVREDADAELALDAADLHLFEPVSGLRIGAADRRSSGRSDGA